MDKQALIEKVNAFLVDEFEIESAKITPNAPIKETLELDSLDYVDLVVIIEEQFGFKVQGEDFQQIISFQDFYNYIESKITNKVE